MKPNNNIDNSTSKQADHTKTMPEVEGPASVLLIAPQGTNSDVIGGCVRSSGHRCTPVGSLDAARTALSTSDFDLVLLDTSAEPVPMHPDAVAAKFDREFARAAANIDGLDVLPSMGANVYDILKRDTLVLTKAGVEALEARLK